MAVISGLRIKRDDGSVQIDQNTRNLYITRSGTMFMVQAAYPGGVNEITVTGCNDPWICFSNGVGLSHASRQPVPNVAGSFKFTVWCHTTGPGSRTVRWFIIDRIDSDTSNFGLRVYNEQHSLVFTSNAPLANFYGIYSASVVTLPSGRTWAGMALRYTTYVAMTIGPQGQPTPIPMGTGFHFASSTQLRMGPYYNNAVLGNVSELCHVLVLDVSLVPDGFNYTP